ncbi:MAG TPA: lactate racemase domain-containing protein [Myxococcota bacterium]|nr:lactate racemase domain-containing protein [Myxococcota bacterium]
MLAESLEPREIHSLLEEGFGRFDVAGKRLLLIVPDGTRTAPIGQVFRALHELLHERVVALDVLVALGTHQPLSRREILARLQLDESDLAGRFAGTRLFNHCWDRPDTFSTLGVIPSEEIGRLSRGLLAVPVRVTVNKLIFDYDLIVICGPVFPHEVVGFSGGNKYLFPGISGSEIIDATHWLGALITCREVIGKKNTPVRNVIDLAAGMIELEKICICLVVGDGGLAGLFVGSPEEAWSRAADLSARIHVRYKRHAFERVLSLMPEMYKDIWTAAKGMYKLEPVVADGGELIIYAPHISQFSHTHGAIIERIGYHVRDYFVSQWDRFAGEPWGVLAHSTHLCGSGTYSGGTENPRVRVSLATGIAPERCAAVGLRYRDPAKIRPDDWRGHEDQGMLLVEHAGEILYRLKGES